MSSKEFWTRIDKALDAIGDEAAPADTFAKVKAALDADGNPDNSEAAAPAFFAGSGGDRTLREALRKAGWRCIWSEASYFYVMQHPGTGETLTYIEGDVYEGDAR